jgi:hypothetical protein
MVILDHHMSRNKSIEGVTFIFNKVLIHFQHNNDNSWFCFVPWADVTNLTKTIN